MLIKSTIDGAVWPGVPERQGAAVLALLFQMEQAQYYDPDDLFDHQRHQLRAVFRHAHKESPFYRRHFAEAGFDPEGEISPATMRCLSPMTRDMFQAAGDGVNATTVPPSHGKPVRISTSGTTGRAVSLYKTPLMQMFWLAYALRTHLWYERDLIGKLAVIRYLDKAVAMAPDGHRFDGWGNEARLLIPRTGPAVALNIASRLAEQADWLVRENPDYLLSYPSNLLALAEYFEAQGLTLPNLRQISTISEVVTPQMRAAYRRAWGVPAVDVYTCEESGHLALQCPDHEHYHVQSENVYLELVDVDGEPCPPGVPGRVLITSLHNFATPLIRYEVGDYAEWGAPCPCGRGLPVLNRIAGRSRNRLILPDGRSEFPYLGEREDWAAISTAVKQFQFVQHSVDEIEKKMVVSEPLTPDQEEATKDLLVKCLGHPFRVTITYHDEIPRGPSGKFEEFVSEVAR